MSRQIGSFHRSVSHPANLQNKFPIIPHVNHLILTSHPAWNQILIPTQHCITPSLNSTTPISKHPTSLQTLNPAKSTFSQLPFQPLHSQVKTEPPSPPASISHVTPTYSPLNSESSDNNDQDHTQISHELDNFITLQQQLQHPQTLTIHQHSRSITSSNPSSPTPSSTYTPSQNPTFPSIPSSSTSRAYRTFKQKFPNTLH